MLPDLQCHCKIADASGMGRQMGNTGKPARATISETHPHLIAQIHPSLNGALDVTALTKGSMTAVWWLCAAGPDHLWQETLNGRTSHQSGCPFCASKRVSVTNSLAIHRPEIAAQWHDTKNGDLTPAAVMVGSSRKVWWRCLAGPDHVWLTAINDRTGSKAAGCPCCAGRQASVTNSLAAIYPNLATEWDRERNGDLSPEQVPSGTRRKVWWCCPVALDHIWQASVESRTRQGTGCLCCAGRQVSITNSLAALHPAIAAQWDVDRNVGSGPCDVPAGTTKRVWWCCSAGADHRWQTSVVSRTSQQSGCPFCSGTRASVTNSLATLRPLVAAEWDSERNGDLTPADVVAGSERRVWWRCDAGEDHVWQATVVSRTAGSGCPCCAGTQLSTTNSLAALQPRVAAEWDLDRNQETSPDQVLAGGWQKAWWRCTAGPDHSWEATVASRTRAGTGCPFCAGLRVSVTNSLAARFPAVAVQWDVKKNGDLTPDHVIAGSERKVWWSCAAGPDHSWEAQVCSRTSQGAGCPFCRGLMVSVTNSLAALHPEVAAEWHVVRNGGLTAGQVVAGSGAKVWWACPVDAEHLWQATVVLRTAQGTGCPSCAITGFRPGMPAVVYLLARDGRRKVGISNVPKQRLRLHRANGWRVLEVSPMLGGLRAYMIEQRFLRALSEHGLRKHRGSDVEDRFDGYTETWDYEALPIDSLTEVFALAGFDPGADIAEAA